MNSGLKGWPQGRELSPSSLFGWPLGRDQDEIRASRTALVDLCLTDNPVVLYTMQEASGFPQDYSGYAFHMTSVSGAGTYRLPGSFGDDYGIRMDGCVFTCSSVISVATDNWTMEALWNIETCVSDDYPNTFALGTGGTATRSLYPTAAGKFSMLFGNIAFMGTSNGSIEGVGYTHVVAVREAGTLKYYLNGSLDTANAGTNAPQVMDASFRIGSSDAGNDFVYAMLAVYDTALSAARIAEHFAQTGIS